MGHLSQCQAFTTHCSVIKGRPKKIIKLEDDLLGIYAILGGPSEIPLVFCSKKPPGKILRDSYPHWAPGLHSTLIYPKTPCRRAGGTTRAVVLRNHGAILALQKVWTLASVSHRFHHESKLGIQTFRTSRLPNWKKKLGILVLVANSSDLQSHSDTLFVSKLHGPWQCDRPVHGQARSDPQDRCALCDSCWHDVVQHHPDTWPQVKVGKPDTQRQ